MTASTSRRDYAGAADFMSLLRFTQRVYTPDSRWHLGDIAWDLGLAPGGEPDSRMSFWAREGEIVGWGWLRLPSTLALLVDPSHTDRLVDEIGDWATEVAGAPVSVGVLETEKELIEPLIRQGRQPGLPGHFFLNMQRELSNLPPVPHVPPGFTVRPVEPGDLSARAGLHRAVWTPALTDEIFAAISARWPYRRELDWVAVAPDGQLVSYVLGWYDDVNRVGEFEPVGTLPQYRRRGLSRAVGISLLHAFRDAGAQRALVYARGDDEYPIPRQTYAALGFRTHGRVVQYHLP